MEIKLSKIKVGRITLNQKLILKNINFLIGPNGSGKSTVLRILKGLYLPSTGQINVNNHIYKLDLNDNKDEFRRNFTKNVLYYESNNIFLNENTTIFQNFKYFMLLNNIDYKEKQENFLTAYNHFNIKDSLNTQIKHLSTGTKQKIFLIFIFLLNKEIVLLDEPFAHLDNNSKDYLYQILTSSKDKKIVITAHDKNQIQKAEGNIIEMKVQP